MAIKLYDLAGKDTNLRFSPFCWRAKLALLHKGLDFETVPWRYTEKDIIAKTGQGRVPVLVDGDRWLHDSWQIALYLDKAYPDRAKLFATDAERTAARFFGHWCDLVIHNAMRPLVLQDVLRLAADKDQPYVRESREKLFGPIDEYCADKPAKLEAFIKALAPAEATLSEFAFFGGERANYLDYSLFGSLQWAHVVSDPLLPADSAIARWFERMLDALDGYARRAPTVRSLAA